MGYWKSLLIIPYIIITEIIQSKRVGQGGFSIVKEISSIQLNEIYDTDERETQIRKEFCNALLPPTSKFVLKSLRTDLPDDEYQKGIVDLAIEAEFLQCLSHPNIISMRAMGNCDPFEPRFFVVLDKLNTTLDLKFNYWRRVVGENAGRWMGPCCGYCFANTHALHSCWKERLQVAHDMASAVAYLHQNQIVYRDLKPDNIGFDGEGMLKIFDFGLAKRWDTVQLDHNGNGYMLTGNTGSLRYMAPEVANDQPYNETVDAYSFGILFWQVCSLTTPYAGYSQKQHAERVVLGGERPKCDATWPGSWVQLMKDCWSASIPSRPSFQAIENMLAESLQELADDDGVVPSRASEIKAKKRKKKVSSEGAKLDLDTRLSHGSEDVTNGAEIV